MRAPGHCTSPGCFPEISVTGLFLAGTMEKSVAGAEQLEKV